MKYRKGSKTDLAVRVIAAAGRALSLRKIREADPTNLSVKACPRLSSRLEQRVLYGELELAPSPGTRKLYRIKQSSRPANE